MRVKNICILAWPGGKEDGIFPWLNMVRATGVLSMETFIYSLKKLYICFIDYTVC